MLGFEAFSYSQHLCNPAPRPYLSINLGVGVVVCLKAAATSFVSAWDSKSAMPMSQQNLLRTFPAVSTAAPGRGYFRQMPLVCYKAYWSKAVHANSCTENI